MDWKQLFIGSLDVLRNISKYLSYRDTVRFLESLKIIDVIDFIDVIDLLKVEDKNGCGNCGNIIKMILIQDIVYPVLLCANHVNIPKKCVLE